MENHCLADRIALARKQASLSKAEAARRLGIPYTTYDSYEKGYREPRLDAIKRIAEILGVNISFLVAGETEDLAPAPPTVDETTSSPFVDENKDLQVSIQEMASALEPVEEIRNYISDSNRQLAKALIPLTEMANATPNFAKMVVDALKPIIDISKTVSASIEGLAGWHIAFVEDNVTRFAPVERAIGKEHTMSPGQVNALLVEYAEWLSKHDITHDEMHGFIETIRDMKQRALARHESAIGEEHTANP